MYSSEYFEKAISAEWSQDESRPFDCSEFEDEFVIGTIKYCYSFTIVCLCAAI